MLRWALTEARSTICSMPSGRTWNWPSSAHAVPVPVAVHRYSQTPGMFTAGTTAVYTPPRPPRWPGWWWCRRVGDGHRDGQGAGGRGAGRRSRRWCVRPTSCPVTYTSAGTAPPPLRSARAAWGPRRCACPGPWACAGVIVGGAQVLVERPGVGPVAGGVGGGHRLAALLHTGERVRRRMAGSLSPSASASRAARISRAWTAAVPARPSRPFSPRSPASASSRSASAASSRRTSSMRSRTSSADPARVSRRGPFSHSSSSLRAARPVRPCGRASVCPSWERWARPAAPSNGRPGIARPAQKPDGAIRPVPEITEMDSGRRSAMNAA
jgi:hypothetical protein